MAAAAAILAEAVEYAKEVGSDTFDWTYWLSIAQTELAVAQAEADFATRSESGASGMVMV